MTNNGRIRRRNRNDPDATGGMRRQARPSEWLFSRSKSNTEALTKSNHVSCSKNNAVSGTGWGPIVG